MKKSYVCNGLSVAFAALLCLSSLWSCKKETTTAQKKDYDVAQIAQEAYLFGLPLVLMDITRRLLVGTDTIGMNEFSHMAVFPDADFRDVVRPNADTYYSNALLDLSGGPLVLSMPNTDGRYHLLQIMDAYTNVIASPGTRTTGNEGGEYLISGPEWTGEVPAGMTEYKSPTKHLWIVGRTQVDSKEDGQTNVKPLMQQYNIRPLNEAGLAQDCAPIVSMRDPNKVVDAMSAQEFFNYLNCLLVINPPTAADAEIVERMAKIGVAPGAQFDLTKFDADEQKKIAEVPQKVMETLLAYRQTVPTINGWSTLGTSNIGNYGTDYLLRAHIANFGLGANQPVDAIYFSCGDKEALSGAKKYILRFEDGKTPPVNAFWSLTMYSEDGYFVANELSRYTLGDRSNLTKDSDGATVIYIQHEKPEDAKLSNWLPAPEGNFNMVLRTYYPKAELLDASWEIPALQTAENHERK